MACDYTSLSTKYDVYTQFCEFLQFPFPASGIAHQFWRRHPLSVFNTTVFRVNNLCDLLQNAVPSSSQIIYTE
jgi:hypothetical protein